MSQLTPGGPDPLIPWTSRFPLSPVGGQVTPSAALPSGPGARPFGLRFAVQPVECGQHDKKPTRKPKTEPTQKTKDGQNQGTESDVAHYVEMDEE